MALYELTEFASYVQSDVDTATATLLRDLVTGLITDIHDFADDYPPRMKAIGLEAARRAYVNPQAITAESVGPFTVRRETGGGVYLTDDEKAEIRTASGAVPTRGLWTQPVTRSEDGGTVYVPTGPEPSGYPFPWYADDVLL